MIVFDVTSQKFSIFEKEERKKFDTSKLLVDTKKDKDTDHKGSTGVSPYFRRNTVSNSPARRAGSPRRLGATQG